MSDTKYSRRNFLKIAGQGAALFGAASVNCHWLRRRKPNILIIVGDDIGYSDIGCYGSEIQTPNLDRLAVNGLRFRQFYNMAKCNPTRSSLFTGLYHGDHRAISFVPLLKEAGYHTLLSGKEHFDDWVPAHCYAHATFDQSFTFWATTEYFVPPGGSFERPFYLNGRELAVSELPGHDKPFYKTDAFTDFAIDWLETVIDDENPFFMMLPYHAAHYPLQARQEDIEKYRGTYKRGWDVLRQERLERMQKLGIVNPDCRLSPPEGNSNRFRGHPEGFEMIRDKIPRYAAWNTLTEDEKEAYDLEMAVFAAMVDRMDQNIGRVIHRLETAGELDNTLILFFSDNGSCPFDSNRDFNVPPGGADSYRCLDSKWANVGNTPFRLYKQNGHEGGCNTHFIAHWPKVIQKNQITDQPGHVVDVFPTLLDVLDKPYPEERFDEATIPLHGASMLPVFRGRQRPEPAFFISGHTERFRMYREGPWKIVRQNGEDWELYDMDTDPTELNNLASERPEKVIEMAAHYQEERKKWRLNQGSIETHAKPPGRKEKSGKG